MVPNRAKQMVYGRWKSQKSYDFYKNIKETNFRYLLKFSPELMNNPQTLKFCCSFFPWLSNQNVLLKSDSLLPKFFYLLYCSLKTMNNCFLLHLKSAFRSQDIYIFVLTHWSCRKNGMIRKIRLISKFLTSQPF